MRKIICDFKYHQKIYLKHLCFNQMCNFIENNNLDIKQFDYLIAIPLHPTRLRERGYNQAELLAILLSQRYEIPVLFKSLKRHRFTTPQSQLPQKERWTNIQEAFKISHPNTLKNKNVLIVDDLLTTGATASEAARVLKKHGAQTVGVLTAAITV